MEFGKWRGRMVAELPTDYLQWLARTIKQDHQKDLLKAVHLELDIRGTTLKMDPSERNRAYFAANRDLFPLPCEEGRIFDESRWDGLKNGTS